MKIIKRKRIEQLRQVSTRISAANCLMWLQPELIISREDSTLLGFNVYRTGKKCKNKHIGWRWTVNTLCIECGRERARKYPDNPKIGSWRNRTPIHKLR